MYPDVEQRAQDGEVPSEGVEDVHNAMPSEAEEAETIDQGAPEVPCERECKGRRCRKRSSGRM